MQGNLVTAFVNTKPKKKPKKNKNKKNKIIKINKALCALS